MSINPMATDRPRRGRRPRFRAFFLPAIIAGIHANEALARGGPEEQAATAREGHRAVAEAELAPAQARREAAALGVKIAQVAGVAAAAERGYRVKPQARIAELEHRGSADRRLVHEEERLQRAQAAERAALLATHVAPARLDVAEATVNAAPRRREAADARLAALQAEPAAEGRDQDPTAPPASSGEPPGRPRSLQHEDAPHGFE